MSVNLTLPYLAAKVPVSRIMDDDTHLIFKRIADDDILIIENILSDNRISKIFFVHKDTTTCIILQNVLF